MNYRENSTLRPFTIIRLFRIEVAKLTEIFLMILKVGICIVANSEANFQFLSDADLNYIVSQIYNQIFKLV